MCAHVNRENRFFGFTSFFFFSVQYACHGFIVYLLDNSSLQCYSVLSDNWVKIELCILLESESTVLSTCNAFVCLSPPSKLKFAVLFCSIYKGLITFSAILF